MPSLTVASPSQLPYDFTLNDGVISLGVAGLPGSALALSDVPPQAHLRLTVLGEAADLELVTGSATLNGMPIAGTIALKNNDLIQLGRCDVRFRCRVQRKRKGDDASVDEAGDEPAIAIKGGSDVAASSDPLQEIWENHQASAESIATSTLTTPCQYLQAAASSSSSASGGPARPAPLSDAVAESALTGVQALAESPEEYARRSGKTYLYRTIRTYLATKRTSRLDAAQFASCAPDGDLFPEAGIGRIAAYKNLAAWPAGRPVRAAAPGARFLPLEHVSGGNFATQYISTSAAPRGAALNCVYSFGVAFGSTQRIRSLRFWDPLIVIDIARLAPETQLYDLNFRDEYLNDPHPQASDYVRSTTTASCRNYAKRDDEVLIVGSIPPEAITSIQGPAWIANQAGLTFSDVDKNFSEEDIATLGLAPTPPAAAAALPSDGAGSQVYDLSEEEKSKQRQANAKRNARKKMIIAPNDDPGAG